MNNVSGQQRSQIGTKEIGTMPNSESHSESHSESLSDSQTISRHEQNGMDNDRLRIIMQTVGTYGVPAVLVVLFYAQVYKPDQDNRRELEKMNSQTLIQVGNTMQMLVDQDRRREASTNEMLRIQADQTRTMQEQTRILQEIMVDQKRGAWNDNEKMKNGGHSAVVKPDP